MFIPDEFPPHNKNIYYMQWVQYILKIKINIFIPDEFPPHTHVHPRLTPDHPSDTHTHTFTHPTASFSLSSIDSSSSLGTPLLVRNTSFSKELLQKLLRGRLFRSLLFHVFNRQLIFLSNFEGALQRGLHVYINKQKTLFILPIPGYRQRTSA